MTGEYVALKALQSSEGWRLLSALWVQQGAKIMDVAQRAAGKGQESAWRYYAGQIKGFETAIMHLDRALLQMEKDQEQEMGSDATKQVESLLKQIKGDPQ